MQSSSEQPLVGEERYVTTLITAAKETTSPVAIMSLANKFVYLCLDRRKVTLQVYGVGNELMTAS